MQGCLNVSTPKRSDCKNSTNSAILSLERNVAEDCCKIYEHETRNPQTLGQGLPMTIILTSLILSSRESKDVPIPISSAA